MLTNKSCWIAFCSLQQLHCSCMRGTHRIHCALFSSRYPTITPENTKQIVVLNMTHKDKCLLQPKLFTITTECKLQFVRSAVYSIYFHFKTVLYFLSHFMHPSWQHRTGSFIRGTIMIGCGPVMSGEMYKDPGNLITLSSKFYNIKQMDNLMALCIL